MVKKMKNLDYYDEPILSKASDQSTYVSLTDVSGGRITKAEIGIIKDFPSATEIAISGLTQNTFEYFVENYGHQFKAIIFWKCPLVGSLKAMEYLDQVEYIVYFWNQAEHLWDFSKTKALKGFCYDDFTRMHDVSEVAHAPALEDLRFGDRVWEIHFEYARPNKRMYCTETPYVLGEKVARRQNRTTRPFEAIRALMVSIQLILNRANSLAKGTFTGYCCFKGSQCLSDH